MNTAVLASLGKYRDFGLLILRVGLGALFIVFGYPKITGGPEMWEKLGGAVAAFGIHTWPIFWGFMAAFAEFVGGILLVFGLFTRPAAFLLLVTMIVAFTTHFNQGDPFPVYSRPLELAVVFLGLLLLGPGKHSVDGK